MERNTNPIAEQRRRGAVQTGQTAQTGKSAPRAPKDPAERRSFCYVLFEAQIEATPRAAGRPSQEVYLDSGRLAEKVRFTGGVEDESVLERLHTCAGFRELVHSIGITAETEGGDLKDSVHTLTFVLQNWGRTSRYETGTTLRMDCPADGAERVLELGGVEWNEDDDVPGKLAFEFDRPGELAKVSVAFYLNDGFAVPEPQMEPPVETGSAAYRAMIRRSLIQHDRTGRLRAAIDRARRGEEVTLGYIGGSITQGAGAKPIHTECYAHLSYRDFAAAFGSGSEAGSQEIANVRFVKAGVGGTPSQLGMIRYERDVLRGGEVLPDIVVVEFAVNDEGDETRGICYESLCRSILNAPNRPAVVLLFSVFMNDWNLQERLIPIGERCGLPMVSVKNAIVPQFGLTREEGGVISKRQFFYDTYHPTNDGHRIMADSLAELFAQAAEEAPSAPERSELPQPVYGADFERVRLLDRANGAEAAIIEAGGFAESDAELQMVELDADPLGTPQFPHNWMYNGSAGRRDKEPFRLKIRSRNLVLVFKDSGSTDFGKAEVYVDGALKLTADPHENNWTHCNPAILYMKQTAAEHTVEIRIAPGDEDKRFTILCFGYTE
ncbi:SGNH/GDSL hydrolase family protein [Saccharibacillus sp. CPCC 101409]|uniref:SGNH/GDSL hydrolase family protein n=1 Tax=Saccharibacillus sp. CPCC 101409 TaxID=3058041 RepID=UPI0026713BCE|nr:SGNH/GDSL hydrolase family protein [Saccharibacillus sp. CPCC 101409]MDO3411866.1 SGNH/GDSL hydrolase family protein [Saccharibacillus sp. CPCC 101409]